MLPREPEFRTRILLHKLFDNSVVASWIRATVLIISSKIKLKTSDLTYLIFEGSRSELPSYRMA